MSRSTTQLADLFFLSLLILALGAGAPVFAQDSCQETQEPEAVAVADEEPSAVTDEEPSAVTDEETVAVTDEEPSEVTDEETVAAADEETVAVTDEETATVTDEESSVETSPIPFDWIEFANREAGTLNTLTIKEIEYRFRWCPAGEFMMGSPTYEEGRNNDEQQHKVRLTNGFWIMETEVTQEMWESVMDDNPSFFKDPHFPVERVSWHDCQKFIMRLNAEGHPPFGLVFALPTEAQWEYACRAGTTSAFSFGDTIDGAQSNVMGFYPKDAPKTERDLGQTSDVKKYPPNPWGLYDMHGNVWEWCHDRYGSFKFDEDVVLADPEGAFLGEKRVLRGGAWNYGAESSRSAAREARHPESIWHCLSLRCVLVPLKK